MRAKVRGDGFVSGLGLAYGLTEVSNGLENVSFFEVLLGIVVVAKSPVDIHDKLAELTEVKDTLRSVLLLSVHLFSFLLNPQEARTNAN